MWRHGVGGGACSKRASVGGGVGGGQWKDISMQVAGCEEEAARSSWPVVVGQYEFVSRIWSVVVGRSYAVSARRSLFCGQW